MALNNRIQSKDRRNRIYVSVNDGQARLYGLAADKRSASLAEESRRDATGLVGYPERDSSRQRTFRLKQVFDRFIAGNQSSHGSFGVFLMGLQLPRV